MIKKSVVFFLMICMYAACLHAQAARGIQGQSAHTSAKSGSTVTPEKSPVHSANLSQDSLVHGTKSAKLVKSPAILVAPEQAVKVHSISINSSGQYAAIAVNPNNPVNGQNTGRIIIWDIETGERTAVLEAEKGVSIWHTAFHPHKPEVLVSSSSDGKIHVWNIETRVHSLESSAANTAEDSFVAFDYSGAYITSGSKEKTLKMWTTLLKHSGNINAVCFNPKNPNILASASADTTVKLWDLEKHTLLRTVQGFTKPVLDVSFRSDGKTAAACSEDGSIRVFDTETGKELAVFEDEGAAVRLTGLSLDGKRLITCSGDYTIKLWDLETQKLLAAAAENASGEWLTCIPEGYFIRSSGLLQGITLELDGKQFKPQQIAANFEDELMVMNKLLTGECTQQNMHDYSLEDIVSRPPPNIVSLTYSPEPPNRSGKITIIVEAEDTGSGIAGVRLNINGYYHTQVNNEHSAKGDIKRFEFSYDLLNGENYIEAEAYNENSYFGISRNDTIFFEDSGKTLPRLWFYAVACNTYEDELLPSLPDPEADVIGIYRQLRGHSKNIYSEVIEPVKKFNKDVSRGSLQELFDSSKKKKIDRNDVFILCITGHGWAPNDGSKYYFMPSNFKASDCIEEADILRKAESDCISANDIANYLKSIKAERKLILLDTCYSGAFFTELGKETISNETSRTLGVSEKRAAQAEKKARRNFISEIGQYATITAASNGQKAQGAYDGHGLFSYFCIQGLMGDADKNGDKTVTVKELAQYTAKEVPKAAYSTFGAEQTPKYYFLFDFALAGEAVPDEGSRLLSEAGQAENAGLYTKAFILYREALSYFEEGSEGAKQAYKALERIKNMQGISITKKMESNVNVIVKNTEGQETQAFRLEYGVPAPVIVPEGKDKHYIIEVKPKEYKEPINPENTGNTQNTGNSERADNTEHSYTSNSLDTIPWYSLGITSGFIWDMYAGAGLFLGIKPFQSYFGNESFAYVTDITFLYSAVGKAHILDFEAKFGISIANIVEYYMGLGQYVSLGSSSVIYGISIPFAIKFKITNDFHFYFEYPLKFMLTSSSQNLGLLHHSIRLGLTYNVLSIF